MTKKQWLIVASVAVAGSLITGGLWYKDRTAETMSGMDHSKMGAVQSHPTYSLNMMSGKSYLAAKPIMLHFAIQDQNGTVLKDFATYHERKMHFIVVRKDRTNFQHVHPTLDEKTGMFMIEPFTFPTDGEYRIFADFTPTNAQKDSMGMPLATTPYEDVKVGDLNMYTPQPIGADKFKSSVNGFDTSFFITRGDDSPGAISGDKFYANQTNTIAISIDKSGKAFTKLQTYLGALGHMVVLGPKLEFIHAHAVNTDVANQSGLVTFEVTFPEAGQYKLYLQTQANDQINTTDYALTAQSVANSTSNSTNSMQGMDHMSH